VTNNIDVIYPLGGAEFSPPGARRLEVAARPVDEYGIARVRLDEELANDSDVDVVVRGDAAWASGRGCHTATQCRKIQRWASHRRAVGWVQRPRTGQAGENSVTGTDKINRLTLQ